MSLTDETNEFFQNGAKWKDNSPFKGVIINKEINISNIFRSNKIFFDDKENEKLVEKWNLDEEVQNKEELKQWNDSSLLSEIITKEYEKEKLQMLLENHKGLLLNNGLVYLKQWKSLSDIEKAIFPLGLRKILDELAGIKLDLNEKEIILEFFQTNFKNKKKRRITFVIWKRFPFY